tara:strand:- start:123 stop:284 length:162 start_codon:yes stop_codon:yes gene_type:complete
LKKNKKIQKLIKKVNNNFCEECKKENKSVFHNLILNGFKICDSCKISKTIFPI